MWRLDRMPSWIKPYMEWTRTNAVPPELCFCPVCVAGVPFLITAELFKQSHRPAAYTVAGVLNWLSNFTIGFIFPFLEVRANLYSTFFSVHRQWNSFSFFHFSFSQKAFSEAPSIWLLAYDFEIKGFVCSFLLRSRHWESISAHLDFGSAVAPFAASDTGQRGLSSWISIF